MFLAPLCYAWLWAMCTQLRCSNACARHECWRLNTCQLSMLLAGRGLVSSQPSRLLALHAVCLQALSLGNNQFHGYATQFSNCNGLSILDLSVSSTCLSSTTVCNPYELKQLVFQCACSCLRYVFNVISGAICCSCFWHSQVPGCVSCWCCHSICIAISWQR